MTELKVNTKGMLPAQAGVILQHQTVQLFHGHAPRAGGGDPAIVATTTSEEICSPRRRG